MPPIVFPTLPATARWTKLNLNAEAFQAFPETFGENTLNNPVLCVMWVATLADYPYGGYMEDRTHLWRNHYHNPAIMRHLGVDYTAPAGTPVAVPADCTVIHVVRDNSYGGWGGCIFFKLATPYRNAPYFLLGHLAFEGLPAVGQVCAKGQVVGMLGAPHENGQWFPHLHAQCFDQTWFDRYAPNLENMDGYGPNHELTNPHCPDPTALMAGQP
ncbi:MAG: peptidoglycan DD-metalloendopeptidase family protein [Alphaproteobacteria bacterium]